MLISIKEDLEELKQLYADNKMQIALYEFVFHNNPAMTALMSIDGKILSVNHRAITELGYTEEEMLGADVDLVIHPDDRAAFHARLLRCINEPGVVTADDMRKIRKDGSFIWVHERCVANLLPDETMVVLVTCENIHHLKVMIDSLEGETINLEAANQELRAICDELKAQYPRC